MTCRASFRIAGAGRAAVLWFGRAKSGPGKLTDREVMFAQVPQLPPALQRIATTPVRESERPVGLPHLKITRLAADLRIHTLGGVRIDFEQQPELRVGWLRAHANPRRSSSPRARRSDLRDCGSLPHASSRG